MWIVHYYRVMSVVARAFDGMASGLESGDADSSGSTLRTVGIVALVLAVVGLLGTTVFHVANLAVVQLGQR